MQLEIFIENACSECSYKKYGLDEHIIYKDLTALGNFIFSDADLIGKSCLKDACCNTAGFDIVFISNSEIRRINREYRNKDSVTDVITFAMFADSDENERLILDGSVNLGEIIISMERIKEQAEENETSFKDELYFIAAHGMLHLLGFDHLNEEDYNFMIDRQNAAKAAVQKIV